MARSPELRSARLVIVPFQERHLSERYVGWLNDRELMRFSEQRHKVHSFASCRAYWQSFSGTVHYFWAIEEVAEGLGHIGNINAYVDEWNKLADMGIMIGEVQAQGKGLGLEAWQAVIGFLFSGVGLRKISAGAMAENIAMLKLMKRSGMVADGVRKRHYLLDGKEMDILHMALFREEWRKETRCPA